MSKSPENLAKDREEYENLVRIEQQALNDRNRNLVEANEHERALCGQLMLISTVFLTVTVVVLGNNDRLSSLSCLGKLLMIFTFCLILSSIACGMKYYFECMNHYKSWAKASHEVYENFRDGMFGAREVKIEELNEKMLALGETSSPLWIKRQIYLLVVAGVCSVILLSIFLFSGLQNSNQLPVNVQFQPQMYRSFH